MYNRLASRFLILAEKELSAFIRAVDKLFGQRSVSASVEIFRLSSMTNLWTLVTSQGRIIY